MKHTIFFSLIFLFLFNALPAVYGQDESKPITGSFEMSNVVVSYSIAPAYPDNLAIQLRPTAEFTLNARIVDAGGQELIKLDVQQVGMRYANSVDISKLAPGDYYVEFLYGESNEQSHRIAFTKQ